VSVADHPYRAVPSDVPALQIRLFGGVIISVDGGHITDLATRKAEALLIYLVCHPHPHPRETLAELLWDDLSAERAAGNLRLILNQLRKRFARFLDITRYTIAIRHDVERWVDVDEFARLLATEPQDIATLAHALELYRGDFLQGFHLRDARGFSEWQAAQVDRWRQRALAAMRALAERYTAHSNYAEGLAWVTRMLAIDPLDEAAHRQKMLLFARSGQRQAAVRQYQACKRTLQEELGLDPEPATEALCRRIRAMPAERPHTLPPCHGQLIGRSAELARVYEWFAMATSRLLTIVGPGGSGKTQLALTVGWRVVKEHVGPCSDGVFYISLLAGDWDTDRVEDDALLVALAEALHMPVASKRTLMDQLVAHLRDNEILVILDNGELLGASARLALGTLVQHAPGLRALVASRERLKIREEYVLNVAGLSHPASAPPGATQRPGQVELRQYASVQLFLERAQRVRGTSDLGDYPLEDQAAIGQICLLVNGLPLAIELATPWLRVRSPREIASEIARGIDFFATDMQDVPERHRSMRAVFEYSWRLIANQERVALAHLSVFPGSFSAEAAQATAAVTLASLTALHDKSLVQSIPTDAETRYALHPLLRQLAQEKLRADPAAEAQVHAQHAHYFAALAAGCEERLHSAEGAETLHALEREIDNLRACWRWAVGAGDIAMLGQCSVTVHDFCAIRSWELEGRQLFQAAAAVVREWSARAAPDDERVPAAVRVLSCYAELQHILGEQEAAEDALQHSRMLLAGQAIEDSPEIMFIYKQLGLIAYGRGAYADSMRYLRFASRIAEDCGEQVKQADILLSIGGVACAQGDWPAAQEALRHCLALYQALDYQWGIGHALRFLGTLALARGEMPSARHYYQESLATAQKIGNRIGEALVLDQLGLLHLAEAQLDQGIDTLRRALAIFQEIGVESGAGRTLAHLGRAAMARPDYDAARQYFLQAIQTARRVQASPLLIESAAGVLQLWQHTHAADPAVERMLLSLWRHPACTAETRQYIAALLPERHTAQVGGAGETSEPLPLERVQELVTTWITGLP
jgi:DNA-binding SARP family transcriptional activator/predicted ATPase